MNAVFKAAVLSALLMAGVASAQSFTTSFEAAQQAQQTFQTSMTQANAEAAVRAAEAARAAATTPAEIAQVNQLISNLNAAIAGANLTVTTAAVGGASAGSAISWGVIASGTVGVAAAYKIYDNQKSP